MDKSEDKQKVLDMFINEGFLPVNSDSIEPDLHLSIQDVESYLTARKEYIASLKEKLTLSRSSMARVDLGYMRSGNRGIYHCEYKGVVVQFYGSPNMSNDAYLNNDAIDVYVTGPSWPFSTSSTEIKHQVVWTSGYNHVFVQVFDKVTIEIEGFTVYQNAKLMDLVFVLDIPGGRATVKEE
ncbi:MAG: hypothetical protein K2J27_09780 [Duncaniella sp.]|nr:hypothetical protein [Duncaniella sp.]